MIGTVWTRPDAHEELQVATLEEAEPGVYHVSTELMHQLMETAGWKRASEDLGG